MRCSITYLAVHALFLMAFVISSTDCAPMGHEMAGTGETPPWKPQEYASLQRSAEERHWKLQDQTEGRPTRYVPRTIDPAESHHSAAQLEPPFTIAEERQKYKGKLGPNEPKNYGANNFKGSTKTFETLADVTTCSGSALNAVGEVNWNPKINPYVNYNKRPVDCLESPRQRRKGSKKSAAEPQIYDAPNNAGPSQPERANRSTGKNLSSPPGNPQPPKIARK